MPLDPVRVALAMDGGLSAVCSTCRLYWEARERAVPGTQCLSKERCGSPLVGDTFHEYDGPMAGALDRCCFVCGTPSKFGARVKGKPQVIGVCADHVALFDQLRAKGKETTPVRSGLVDANGRPLSPVAAPKKSLASAIKEVEDYYAKRDEVEPA